MENIFKITLDISKKDSSVNAPVVLRQGDSTGTATIVATILDHGKVIDDLVDAGFYCTKPDKTVVINDSASVMSNVVTYKVNSQVSACSGTLERAFFMLNGETVSTSNIDIFVLKGVDPAGNSSDYLPGLAKIQNDWKIKLDELSSQINKVDISDQLKQLTEDAFDKVYSELDSRLQDVKTRLNKTMNSAKESNDDVQKQIVLTQQYIDSLSDKQKEIDNWISSEHGKVFENVDQWKKEFDTQLEEDKKEQSEISQSIESLNQKLKSIAEQVTAIDVPSLNTSIDEAKKNAEDALKIANSKTDTEYVNHQIVGVLNNEIVEDSNLDKSITKLGYAKSSDVPSIDGLMKESKIKVMSETDYSKLVTPDQDVIYLLTEG